MGAPVWTDKLDQRITDLYKDHSAKQIIAVLGMDGYAFSRSAVQGRLRRLGITAEGKTAVSPQTPHSIAPKVRAKKQPPVGSTAFKVINGIKRQKNAPEAKPRPFVCRDAADVEPLHIGIMDLTKDTCRWPFGDNPPFTFCGHLPFGSSSYCKGHFRLSLGSGSRGEQFAHRVSRRVA